MSLADRLQSHHGGPKRDFGELARRFESNITPARLRWLSSHLGVTVDSLRRLRVGWDDTTFTFPMSNRGIVEGVRRRRHNGCKFAYPGSKNGLFLPVGRLSKEQLFIAEGETDTAALLGFHLDAIGRPGCTACVAQCVDVAQGRDVVVVADHDGPGQRGAAALVNALCQHATCVQIVLPSFGFKDIRAELRAGLTAGQFRRRVDEAVPFTPPNVVVHWLSR